MAPRAKREWHLQAKKFYRCAIGEYKNFSDDELSILQATVENLSLYYKAVDLLEVEGLTVQAGNMVRKHPASEILKNAWAGFIKGCKHLDIATPDRATGKIGRPLRS